MTHKILIEQIEESRVILTVNGFEIDVQSDEDGICGMISKAGIVQSDFSFDYEEKHINE